MLNEIVRNTRTRVDRETATKAQEAYAALEFVLVLLLIASIVANVSGDGSIWVVTILGAAVILLGGLMKFNAMVLDES